MGGEEDGKKPEPSDGPYRRVLLKVSGESLCEKGGSGFNKQAIEACCRQIAAVHKSGHETAVVTGGGNLIRGAQLSHLDLDRAQADYMGMLGTVINALAIQGCLEEMGVDTRVLSAIMINQVVEPYIRRRADASPREGSNRHPRGRHGEPVREHGHRGRAPRS